jgi:PAS domain S-box-containing protein
LTASDRHTRAREQTLGLMVEAVRAGEYLDALHWLNTLATVDLQFSLTADEILARWRERARLFRDGAAPAVSGEEASALADYRGLFAAFLERSFDGVVISDLRDGWMLECSPSFSEITGYPRSELLGRTSTELGLIDAGLRSEAVDSARKEGSVGHRRATLRRRDGELRTVEFSAQILPGDELLLSIVRDVTDRRP